MLLFRDQVAVSGSLSEPAFATFMLLCVAYTAASVKFELAMRTVSADVM